MKSGTIFVALCAVFSIVLTTGCADKKDAKHTIAEHDARVAEANTRMKDLVDNYDINLAPVFFKDAVPARAQSYDWSKMTPEKRKEVASKLKIYVDNVDRIDELSHRKSVKTSGDNGVLAESRGNALLYSQSLKAFEDKQKVAG